MTTKDRGLLQEYIIEIQTTDKTSQLERIFLCQIYI